MNVFICHASEQKPLIREIRSFLKKDVFWIDDEKLCIGSEIKKKLKETINYKTDIVLLFVCDKSIKSHWVKEEVDWAIEKEKEIGYNFLIPVILDEKAWNEIEIEELKNRIYLKLNGFTTSDIKSFADELNDKLFKWLINSKKNESNYEEKPLYNMELKLIPGNILHSSALTSYEGENHLIFVTLKINEKGNTDKNTIDGIPCFQLTMSNLGADLEIEDVQMVFKEPQERPQDPIKNGKVNPDSIISVKINNNNIRIKGNHTELLSISDRLSFELILRRGIDTIVAIDVMKNEYKVDKHEIEAAMRYVNYFYSIDGFVDFYDEFINRNQN